MLELALVALYRPGWFVPNSADVVKSKALHQEKNLRVSFLSKFREEGWAVQCLASLRGESRGTTLSSVEATCPSDSTYMIGSKEKQVWVFEGNEKFPYPQSMILSYVKSYMHVSTAH